MTMKYIPLIFLFAFMTGCQSLPQREPVIVPPTVMRSVNFILPSQTSRMMNHGESFNLVLKLNINKKGTVDRSSIQKSSGNRHLDRKAMMQARRMIFNAATEDGKFVKSTATLPITYEIPEDVRYR